MSNIRIESDLKDILMRNTSPDTSERQLQFKTYKNIKKVAPGTFRGEIHESGKSVLIKCFEFNQGQGWNFLLQIKQEIEILKTLDHNCIPKYIDSWQDDSFYLVREYVAGNCLVTAKYREEKEIIAFGCQLLNILKYLESQSVVHHDLKPQNIILDEYGAAYLIDFGISKVIGDHTLGMTTQFAGTQGFTAPEKFLLKKADHRSDLYSLGMLLACMVAQIKPQSAIDLLDEDFELIQDLLEGKCSKGLLKIINKLVRRKASDRYQSSNLVLEDLDWQSKKIIKSTESKIEIESDLNWIVGKTFYYKSYLIFESLDKNQHFIIKKTSKISIVEEVIFNQFQSETDIYTYARKITPIDFDLKYIDLKDRIYIINQIANEIKFHHNYDCLHWDQSKYQKYQNAELIDLVKAPENKPEDIDWILKRGKILDENKKFLLIKIYINLTLLPQHKMILLIANNKKINKRIWAVPPYLKNLKQVKIWSTKGKIPFWKTVFW